MLFLVDIFGGWQSLVKRYVSPPFLTTKFPLLRLKSREVSKPTFFEKPTSQPALRFQLRLWSLQQDQWDIVSLAARLWMSPHWNWFLTPHENSGWNSYGSIDQQEAPGSKHRDEQQKLVPAPGESVGSLLFAFWCVFFMDKQPLLKEETDNLSPHVVAAISCIMKYTIMISTKWSKLLIEEILHNLGCRQCITREIHAINCLSTCAGFQPINSINIKFSQDPRLEYSDVLILELSVFHGFVSSVCQRIQV